jgi:CoA transferase family III
MAPAAIHEPRDLDTRARIAVRLLGDLSRLPGLRAARAAIASGSPAGRVQFPGLPTGTLETAHGYAAAAAALMAPQIAGRLPIDAARAVLLPLALADAEGRPRPPRSQPRFFGAGALCADLQASQDEQLFARLLDTMSASERTDAEHVAAAGQSWRLALLPYRSRSAADAERAGEAGGGSIARVSWIGARCESSSKFRLERRARPLTGLRICDLSTMWAGPLATAMMRSLGASVVKIEMPTRPDGMRRSLGAGPDEESSSPVFATLNAGKRLMQLDLRRESDRARFERLLASSDMVVESFSRRVMPNLGYDEETLRAIRPDLLIAAVRAFPPGEKGAWTAYGSGVHAASGLADVGPGRFGAACVSYPDPLAGIALFAAMTGQVVSRERAGRASTVEVSLWDALRPLLDLPQPGELELEPTAEQLIQLAPELATSGRAG